MPVFFNGVPSVHEAITRPVALAVVKQVMIDSQIPAISRIRFPGDMGQWFTLSATTEGLSEYPVTFGSDSNVDISIEEEYQPSFHPWSKWDNNGRDPIWYDDQLGVEIRPMTVSVKTTIKFTYRCPSKDDAYRWKNALANRFYDKPLQQLHSAYYEYLFPTEVLQAISHIHELREKNCGYGEDLNTYFTKHANARIVANATMDGKKQRLAVAETLKRIPGIYDFYTVPTELNSDDRNNRWIVDFSYMFEWDKITEIRTKLPVFVHNQRIDSKYLTLRGPNVFNHYTTNTRYGQSDESARIFDPTNEINLPHGALLGYAGLEIPNCDEFRPSYREAHEVNLLTAAVVVKDKAKHLVNLKDLSTYGIHPDLLWIISRNPSQAISLTRTHFVHISVFQNDTLVDPSSVELDSDLNLSLKFEANGRMTYHFRIAVNSVWQFISKEVLETIRCKVKLLNLLLQFISPGYRTIVGDEHGCITMSELTNIVNDTDKLLDDDRRVILLSSALNIITMRKEA